MKIMFCAGLVALMLPGGAEAQDPTKPELRAGVSVQMAAAGHAVEMRAADELDATVVAITADGRLFLGVTAAEPSALTSLAADTVYVKADARAPFQKLLTVLEALRGKSVVLLSAPPANALKGRMVPPYGIRLTVPR